MRQKDDRFDSYSSIDRLVSINPPLSVSGFLGLKDGKIVVDDVLVYVVNDRIILILKK